MAREAVKAARDARIAERAAARLAAEAAYIAIPIKIRGSTEEIKHDKNKIHADWPEQCTKEDKFQFGKFPPWLALPPGGKPFLYVKFGHPFSLLASSIWALANFDRARAPDNVGYVLNGW